MPKRAIREQDVTPEAVYRSRRRFLQAVGATAVGTAVLKACGPAPVAAPEQPAAVGEAASPTMTPTTAMTATGTPTNLPPGTATRTGSSSLPPTETPTLAPTETPTLAPTASPTSPPTGPTSLPISLITPYDLAIGYNNYYEFSTDKEAVALLAQGFATTPWTISVGGLVRNPKVYALEDVLRLFPQQERIYRHRCVEGWSMVVPWSGFPLHKLLAAAEPTAAAKYVRFTTVLRPDQMPGQHDGFYRWPYAEGLRLDEAMHDLTLLAAGMYGRPLQPQNGAPLRLVVPWKYGFKSAKAIVGIEVVDQPPVSFWMAASPSEYGFYANVNPAVSHPRWSQKTERPLGDSHRQKTLPFNGYADEVAHLYVGMDLQHYF